MKFFWKNGYNVTSQTLELCIVNWSMKKNVRHKPNENLRNGFDNEETQKTKWALFTIWLQIKLFKNENLPQSVQNSKNRKESQKMCKIQKFKWKWHGNKMPYLQQNIHTKNGKEQNLNTLKSCINNKITKKKVLESGMMIVKIFPIWDIFLQKQNLFFAIYNSALLHVIVLMKNPLLFAAHHGIVRVGEEFGETGGKVTHELVGHCSQWILHFLWQFPIVVFL